MPAPAYPPSNACELEVGKPKYQVMRFQKIAPNSAQSRTYKRKSALIKSIRTPSPIALATRVPKTANATKLKNAAHTTARPGERTRVETTVAIEFAAS